jgi:hypothetical protein
MEELNRGALHRFKWPSELKHENISEEKVTGGR